MEKDRQEIKLNSEHEPTLISSLEVFYKNEEFFDIVLKTDDSTEIQAHKIILSAFSPYFYEKLRGNPKKTIEVPGVKSFTLKSIVEYIYIGTIKISVVNFVDILRAAVFLRMKNLILVCHKFIKLNLNLNNFWTIFKLACNEYELKETFKIIISTLFEEFTSTPEFLQLTESELSEVLQLNLKSSECLQVEQAIKILLSWVEHDKDIRRQRLLKLLTMICDHYNLNGSLQETGDSNESLSTNMDEKANGSESKGNKLDEKQSYNLDAKADSKKSESSNLNEKVNSAHSKSTHVDSKAEFNDSKNKLSNEKADSKESDGYETDSESYESESETEQSENTKKKSQSNSLNSESQTVPITQMKEKTTEIRVLYCEEVDQLEIYGYDPNEDNWELKDQPSVPYIPRENHSSIVIGDKFYMVGGKCREQGTNTAECWDLKTQTMIRMPPMRYARSWSQLTKLDNYLFVYGGKVKNDKDEMSLDIFNIDTKKWKLEVPPITPSPNSRIVAHKNVVYIFDAADYRLQYYDVFLCRWNTVRIVHSIAKTNYQIAAVGNMLYVFSFFLHLHILRINIHTKSYSEGKTNTLIIDKVKTVIPVEQNEFIFQTDKNVLYKYNFAEDTLTKIFDMPDVSNVCPFTCEV